MVAHQADQLVTSVVGEGILEAMKKVYITAPKPPTPLARAGQLPRMAPVKAKRGPGVPERGG